MAIKESVWEDVCSRDVQNRSAEEEEKRKKHKKERKKERRQDETTPDETRQESHRSRLTSQIRITGNVKCQKSPARQITAGERQSESHREVFFPLTFREKRGTLRSRSGVVGGPIWRARAVDRAVD